MDQFYTIVIVIAVISLVLCLVAVGISLQSSTTKVPFPTTQATCPDGWGTDASFCYIPDFGNKGTSTLNLSASNNNDASSNVWNTYKTMDSGFSRKTTATICDKQIWARNSGVLWDGVTNYNQCK